MSSIDVIVPCYRYAHFLRQCVESVLGQSLRDLRVLIIDDFSPDNTAQVAEELVKQDPRVYFVQHRVNQGHINTYNEGIDWATSDYLLVLSADDFLLPGALQSATELMDANPLVGFTFGKSLIMGEHLPEEAMPKALKAGEPPSYRILSGLDFIEFSGPRNIVSTPTAVVRTRLQKLVGGYRTELPHAGDMEMWFRLAAHGSVGIFERYQAVYRKHSQNMSLQYTDRGWLPDVQQRKAALECFFEECSCVLPQSPRLRRRLFRSLACVTVGLASTAFNDSDFQTSEQLGTLARDICPSVRLSRPWFKLACKRRLGTRAWRALRPVTARLRRALPR